MSDKKDYYHDKGEQDASDGKYEPPFDPATVPFLPAGHLDDQKAYNDGYRNTKEQKSGNK